MSHAEARDRSWDNTHVRHIERFTHLLTAFLSRFHLRCRLGILAASPCMIFTEGC